MLSFNPGASKLLTEKQAKELRFLGVLMATFSSVESLKKILSSLERPYAYSTSDIYYSWHRHEWLELPQPPPQPQLITPTNSPSGSKKRIPSFIGF